MITLMIILSTKILNHCIKLYLNVIDFQNYHFWTLCLLVTCLLCHKLSHFFAFDKCKLMILCFSFTIPPSFDAFGKKCQKEKIRPISVWNIKQLCHNVFLYYQWAQVHFYVEFALSPPFPYTLSLQYYNTILAMAFLHRPMKTYSSWKVHQLQDIP